MGSRCRKLRGRRDGPLGGTVSSGWASPAQLGEQGSPQGVCPSDTEAVAVQSTQATVTLRVSRLGKAGQAQTETAHGNRGVLFPKLHFRSLTFV